MLSLYCVKTITFPNKILSYILEKIYAATPENIHLNIARSGTCDPAVNLLTCVDHTCDGWAESSALLWRRARYLTSPWECPPSGEMNGHQHNPLSAHVSWYQQNTFFFFLNVRSVVWMKRVSSCCRPPCRHSRAGRLIIRLPLPPGDEPVCCL